MNILIVDDEPLILQGLLNGVQWELLQFRQVLTAKSAEQAQRIMENQPVHILLTDIEMGGESGLDLIRWANEHKPETKCIVLSCHDEFGFAQQAVRLDCFDYVLKPVPYDVLTQLLLRAQKQVRQERGQALQENYGKAYASSLREELGQASESDALALARQYLQEHLSEEMSVESLARVAHVSPRHLGRLFQKEYGQSVGDYITAQRMALAGELLRTTHLSVTRISDRVGYSNYSYFIRQFKKHYGQTPGEYQKRIGEFV